MIIKIRCGVNISFTMIGIDAISSLHREYKIDKYLELRRNLDLDFVFIPLGVDSSQSNEHISLLNFIGLEMLKHSSSWGPHIKGKITVEWSWSTLSTIVHQLDIASYLGLSSVLLPSINYHTDANVNNAFANTFFSMQSPTRWKTTQDTEFISLVEDIVDHMQTKLCYNPSKYTDHTFIENEILKPSFKCLFIHVVSLVITYMLKYPLMELHFPIYMIYRDKPCNVNEINHFKPSSIIDDQWFVFHTVRSLVKCVHFKLCANQKMGLDTGGNIQKFMTNDLTIKPIPVYQPVLSNKNYLVETVICTYPCTPLLGEEIPFVMIDSNLDLTLNNPLIAEMKLQLSCQLIRRCGICLIVNISNHTSIQATFNNEEIIKYLNQVVELIESVNTASNEGINSPQQNAIEAINKNRPYEDALQLPMHPLIDKLPSSVYEVFEKDTRKYELYKEAITTHLKNLFIGAHKSHLMHIADHFNAQHACVSSVFYITILGAGRGPLLDCIIDALGTIAKLIGISELDIAHRLRCTLIEHNYMAVQYLVKRREEDPKWAMLSPYIRVIVGDGRYIGKALSTPYPYQSSTTIEITENTELNSGILCDAIISELLGSFGDNELSAECITGYINQLCSQILSPNLSLSPLNPNLVCIPSSTTSYVAPIMNYSIHRQISRLRPGLVSNDKDTGHRFVSFDIAYIVRNWRSLNLCAVKDKVPHSMPVTSDGLYTNSLIKEENNGVATPLSGAQEVFRINSQNCAYCSRTFKHTFTVTTAGVITALCGYFESTLLLTDKSNVFSTLPGYHTPGMYSWFPIIFPLPFSQHLNVIPGNQVEICICRNISDNHNYIWYEWSAQLLNHPETQYKCMVNNKDAIGSYISLDP